MLKDKSRANSKNLQVFQLLIVITNTLVYNGDSLAIEQYIPTINYKKEEKIRSVHDFTEQLYPLNLPTELLVLFLVENAY